MEIVNASVTYVESYCDLVDEVAREGKWLAVDRGFSLAETVSFMRNCAAKNGIQLFLKDEEKVLGWCDIIPLRTNRTGSLGIGLKADYRGQGWGSKLLDCALQRARTRFKKVILYVRESNEKAVIMYSKRGFTVRKKYKSRAYKGVPECVLMMVKSLKKKD